MKDLLYSDPKVYMEFLAENGFEEGIHEALWKIDSAGFGEFMDIKFDFRWEFVDFDIWTRLQPLCDDEGKIGQRSISGSDFIWFPWMGDFDQLMRIFPDAVRPTYFATKGDYFYATDAILEEVDGEFQSIFDDCELLIYYECKKNDGTIIKFIDPIRYIDHLAFEGNGSYAHFTDKVFGRVNRFVGKDLHELEKGSDTGDENLNAAIFYAKLYLKKAREISNPKDGNNSDIRILSNVLDIALKLGYFWGKTETSRTMIDLARIGRETIIGAGAGGLKSGEVRRKKAEITWQPHATELACRARELEPGLSQDSVASEISALWKLSEVKCPGHARLKQFVGQLERSDRLPVRFGRQRPDIEPGSLG